jgi:hypothetical protein
MTKPHKNLALFCGWHIIDVEIHDGKRWKSYLKYGVCNLKLRRQYKVEAAKELLERIKETAPLRALIDGEVMAQTDEWREVSIEQWRALSPARLNL